MLNILQNVILFQNNLVTNFLQIIFSIYLAGLILNLKPDILSIVFVKRGVLCYWVACVAASSLLFLSTCVYTNSSDVWLHHVFLPPHFQERMSAINNEMVSLKEKQDEIKTQLAAAKDAGDTILLQKLQGSRDLITSRQLHLMAEQNEIIKKQRRYERYVEASHWILAYPVFLPRTLAPCKLTVTCTKVYQVSMIMWVFAIRQF